MTLPPIVYKHVRSWCRRFNLVPVHHTRSVGVCRPGGTRRVQRGFRRERHHVDHRRRGRRPWRRGARVRGQQQRSECRRGRLRPRVIGRSIGRCERSGLWHRAAAPDHRRLRWGRWWRPGDRFLCNHHARCIWRAAVQMVSPSLPRRPRGRSVPHASDERFTRAKTLRAQAAAGAVGRCLKDFTLRTPT